MISPEGCNCYHENSWSKNIIQCSNNDYQNLPTNIPMDATEIYLDGNNLGVLKSHSLIGRELEGALSQQLQHWEDWKQNFQQIEKGEGSSSWEQQHEKSSDLSSIAPIAGHRRDGRGHHDPGLQARAGGQSVRFLVTIVDINALSNVALRTYDIQTCT